MAAWVPMKSGDPLPEGAVWAGNDKSGSFYVGRSFEDESVPEAASGAYVASQRVFIHTYASRVIQRDEFEILTYNVTDQHRLVWVKADSGWIPPRAVLAGVNLETGLEIFIGRWLNQGLYTPGKIYRSNQNIFAPCGNFECFSNEYEVLVEL
ncbi:hypothetical protein R5R35_006930 [Gryllus longicercus]|uniref:Uncharacterized protein n=1 Tax=Gryllus longicercus TaxID=2509291 RepID=A0AAN9YW44_9ORTH